MQSRDFCYWLQGYFEVSGKNRTSLGPEQVETIKSHLAMVFAHEIDPAMGDKTHQDKLNNLHGIGGKTNDGMIARC